jgi:hypothetical protein
VYYVAVAATASCNLRIADASCVCSCGCGCGLSLQLRRLELGLGLGAEMDTERDVAAGLLVWVWACECPLSIIYNIWYLVSRSRLGFGTWDCQLSLFRVRQHHHHPPSGSCSSFSPSCPTSCSRAHHPPLKVSGYGVVAGDTSATLNQHESKEATHTLFCGIFNSTPAI